MTDNFPILAVKHLVDYKISININYEQTTMQSPFISLHKDIEPQEIVRSLFQDPSSSLAHSECDYGVRNENTDINVTHSVSIRNSTTTIV